MYCVNKWKHSANAKNVPQTHQPVPVYEDVHHMAQSIELDKETLELKENVAYGPLDVAR